MDTITKKLVLTENSLEEQYKELYKLQMGDVFKIESGYETVMRRIEDYLPKGQIFKVFPITPGTDLFILYGPDHCVVTNNQKEITD